ncbi:MAG: radical SAM protein [Candidatus Abyssobacteria bacterium SURF_5]|uniref:Radical SAM protein n=1 Tax=Abyssobacteria bacterium (strain SURF_5) TaxID=2093360 RepID=A0A3A4NLA7_ABYX5|nr:MAG: radical SAM protein [Candidatus Abyssubacteria bacterium SURF_5]
MSENKILLINPNLMKPPVAPIAIDYLASALQAAGFSIDFLDLAFEDDIDTALRRAAENDFLYIGITIRNVDDSYFATRDFCLARIRPIIERLRQLSDAPLVLGGVGYSIFPAAALEYLGADYGIRGDGEAPAIALGQALLKGNSTSEIAGLVWRQDGNIRQNPPAPIDLNSVDLTQRETVDNKRYFREGGMVGFESKRGCSGSCSYCADPQAKGTNCRLRPPDEVARELAGLADRGITCFHTCDSEFNIPRSHAADVCRAMIRAGLDEKMRWYAYMNPAFFDKELALLMKRTGCAGINFGADHSNALLLKALGRAHSADSLLDAARLCREQDIECMFDLLLGSPGETPDTLREAIDFMKNTPASCIGASLGVRLYPHTPLADKLLRLPEPQRAGIHGLDGDERNLLRPVYYVSPFLGDDPYALLADVVGGDDRFFVASPQREGNDYNYNNNSVLSDAIRSGESGAFWNILRRMKQKNKP